MYLRTGWWHLCYFRPKEQRGMLAFFSCRVMSVLEAWDVGSSVTCTMEVNTYRYQVPGVKVHAPVKSGFPLNYISSKCLCSSRAVGVWCCAASFTSFQHVHVIAVVVVACMPSSRVKSFHDEDVNWEPWSVVSSAGDPNRDIQPAVRALTQVSVSMFGMGYASGHREKRSTAVNK